VRAAARQAWRRTCVGLALASLSFAERRPASNAAWASIPPVARALPCRARSTPIRHSVAPCNTHTFAVLRAIRARATKKTLGRLDPPRGQQVSPLAIRPGKLPLYARMFAVRGVLGALLFGEFVYVSLVRRIIIYCCY